MSAFPVRRHAKVTLPAWAWGGNPTGLFEAAGVHVARDRSAGHYTVQTGESYGRTSADLVSYKHIAGPGVRREDFGHLDTRQDIAEVAHGETVARELEKREARLRQTRNPVHAIEMMRLRVMTTPTVTLGDAVRHEYGELLEVPLEGEPTTRVFANAGVHLMERAHILTWRLKIPMLLCQMSQDSRLLAGDATHLQQASLDGGRAFKSAGGLAEGAYLLDAYVGPLLGALTPSVWCVSVPRGFGTILFSLGQPLAGSTGNAEEMLHMIGGPGASSPQKVPRLAERSGHAAIRWWSNALNSMFAVLSDFAVFTDAHGVYRPFKHMQAILTMDQLFRRTTSAAVADRDTNARRVLMFSALDTVERLTRINMLSLASPQHATAVLDGLVASLPAEAAEVLLPAASRSAVALHELAEGFFVHSMLGRQDLLLQFVNGTTNTMSVDRATAYYLKALRDATHGHGSDKPSARDRTNALLAQHDGDVPHDLGLLSTLYLLDLLDHPDRLRARLVQWSAED